METGQRSLSLNPLVQFPVLVFGSGRRTGRAVFCPNPIPTLVAKASLISRPRENRQDYLDSFSGEIEDQSPILNSTLDVERWTFSKANHGWLFIWQIHQASLISRPALASKWKQHVAVHVDR